MAQTNQQISVRWDWRVRCVLSGAACAVLTPLGVFLIRLGTYLTQVAFLLIPGPDRIVVKIDVTTELERRT